MTLALSVLPLVFIIACGYLLAKTNILPKADWKGIETLSFRVLIPAILILTITHTDLSLGRFGGVMIALLLTWAVLAALAAAEQFIGTQGLGVMAVAIALHPLIAPCIFAALAVLLGLNAVQTLAGVLVFAAPAASNGFIIAKQMGGDADLYADVLTWQTLLCLFVLPIWAYVLIG